jgi:hypothetical protein
VIGAPVFPFTLAKLARIGLPAGSAGAVPAAACLR